MKCLCTLIWNFAERHGFYLGVLGPFIVAGMIGSRPQRKR